MYNIMHTDLIDFRNGRFQGQTRAKQPHGVGIFIDINFLFCLAEWQNGQINGNCFIVFPDSKIFCGTILQKAPTSLCSFYLSERKQVFGYYQNKQRNGTKENNNQPKESQCEMTANLPFLKLLISIDMAEGDPQLKDHYSYSKQSPEEIARKLQSMLKINDKSLLKAHKDWKTFVQSNFEKYKPKLTFYEKGTSKSKQFQLRMGSDGLGITIELLSQNAMQSSNGQSYLIRSVGCLSEDALPSSIGLRTLDHYPKGYTKEEGIYSSQQIVRYQENQRPKQCIKNIVNHLKYSLFFQNQFIQTQYLLAIEQAYLQINVRMVYETQKIAQIILETPNNIIVLAQVENKQHQKTIQQQLIQPIQQQLIQSNQEQNTKPSAKLYLNPQFHIDQTKSSIYKSVEKIKQNKSSQNPASTNYNRSISSKNLEKKNDQPESYAKQDRYNAGQYNAGQYRPEESKREKKYKYLDEDDKDDNTSSRWKMPKYNDTSLNSTSQTKRTHEYRYNFQQIDRRRKVDDKELATMKHKLIHTPRKPLEPGQSHPKEKEYLYSQSSQANIPSSPHLYRRINDNSDKISELYDSLKEKNALKARQREEDRQRQRQRQKPSQSQRQCKLRQIEQQELRQWQQAMQSKMEAQSAQSKKKARERTKEREYQQTRPTTLQESIRLQTSSKSPGKIIPRQQRKKKLFTSNQFEQA